MPIKSIEEAATGRIIRSPISGACGYAIRLLGQRVHELVRDVDGMHVVAERAADRDPDHWGQRLDIIDKRWDGIGSWVRVTDPIRRDPELATQPKKRTA
jgi:hypothetical protein